MRSKHIIIKIAKKNVYNKTTVFSFPLLEILLRLPYIYYYYNILR